MKIKTVFISIVALILLFCFFWKAPFLYEKAIYFQKDIFHLFTNLSDKQDKNFLVLLLGATFLYGFLHALGPGHGKSFLMSFLLRGNISKKQLLAMSFIIAALQSILAFVTVKVILHFSLESAFLSSFSWQDQIQIFSAISLILLGLFSFFQHKQEKKTESKSCFYFSCALGLCPCPGIMSMLLFIHILGYQQYDILFALSAASGMFVLLLLVSFLGKSLEHLFFAKAVEKHHSVFHFLSSFLLVLLGIFVLLSYLF